MSSTQKTPDVMERFQELQERVSKVEEAGVVRSQPKSLTMSYFEEDDAPEISLSRSQMKAMRRENARRGRSLRKLDQLVDAGYESQFKSMSAGDFLRGVAADPASEEGQEFKRSYLSSKKSLINTIGSGLSESQKKAIGLNTFEADSAGSLVLPEFAPTIMEKNYTNSLWQSTDNYTVAGNSMTFPKSKDENRKDGLRSGGITGHWVGEEKEMNSSRPGVEDLSLKLKKLCIIVFVTEELLDDASYALEQWISRKVREEIDFRLGDATVRGNGVKQPTGWLGHSSSVDVPALGSQGAKTLVGQNIVDMYERRIAGQTSQYAWYVNQDVESQLAGLTLGANDAAQLVYQPPGALASAPNGSLMGLPIIPTEFNSSIGNSGDIALCDYSKMITIGKGGVTEDVSTHVEFLRDQVAYKFTIRVDGRPCDDTPITPYQGDNKQSAFITLADRL